MIADGIEIRIDLRPVYQFSGNSLEHRAEQVQIDLWYADGQWIALEALALGGRRLRYELI